MSLRSFRFCDWYALPRALHCNCSFAVRHQQAAHPLCLIAFPLLARLILEITFVLLGARVVTDYIVAALNPVKW